MRFSAAKCRRIAKVFDHHRCDSIFGLSFGSASDSTWQCSVLKRVRGRSG